MPEPFLGEIRMFAGNYAPVGWVLCDGRKLPVDEYSSLFSLIGTTYGGNGSTYFCAPDLRGRIPVHHSRTLPIGVMGGTEMVNLTSEDLPPHSHEVRVLSDAGTITNPSGEFIAAHDFKNFVTTVSQSPTNMSPHSLEPTGGSYPHDNIMPSLTITFIMATEGIVPYPE